MVGPDRAALASLRSLPGFLVGSALPESGEVELDEDAAHHMRVRRLAEGAEVRVSDGAGALARAVVRTLGKRMARVELVERVRQAPPPPVHLLAPVADRERMLWLAEKAAELGVSSWRAVSWRRSRSVSPRGEGDAFRGKVRARMASALVQSAGAWLPLAEPDVPVTDVAAVLPPDAFPILLDAGGEPLLEVVADDALAAGAQPFVAVGPEGGMDDDEREHLAGAGFRVASLGEGILRFETAGVAALAVLAAGRAAAASRTLSRS